MKYAVRCEKREVFFSPITNDSPFRNRLVLNVDSRFRIVQNLPVLEDVVGELVLIHDEATIPMHKHTAKDLDTLLGYMTKYCEERVFGLRNEAATR